MTTTLQTTLHTYRFNIDKRDEHAAYNALREKLQADGRHFFNVWDDGSSRGGRCKIEEGVITLDCSHLFSDQWNTAEDSPTNPGFRVFDWYEGIVHNKRIKKGHWLEITDEMRELRRNTHICGYCGKQEPAAKGYTFCPHCLDSEYLKSRELYLLRMLPIEQHLPARPPLTEAELAHLMPQYIERQTTGADSRAVRRQAEARADVIAKRDKDIESANTRHDGLIWLLDRNVSINNVIYYEHTGVFTFGWRSPVSDEVASELLNIISEFPFPYEIKGESRTWEGY